MPQFCGVSGFRYTGLSVSPQDWGENDFQASRKLTGNQNPPRSAAVNQCYLGDGSLHKVPVVNCNALKYLQEYGDEEDVGDGNGFWYITTE